MPVIYPERQNFLSVPNEHYKFFHSWCLLNAKENLQTLPCSVSSWNATVISKCFILTTLYKQVYLSFTWLFGIDAVFLLRQKVLSKLFIDILCKVNILKNFCTENYFSCINLYFLFHQMKTEFGVDHVYNADSFNEMEPKSRLVRPIAG